MEKWAAAIADSGLPTVDITPGLADVLSTKDPTEVGRHVLLVQRVTSSTIRDILNRSFGG